MPHLRQHTYKRHIEDAGLALPGLLVVLDGATSIDPDRLSNLRTHRFTHFIASEMECLYPGPHDLLDALTASIESAQNALGHHRAYSTMSAVAWDTETMTTAVIGDSPILIEGTDRSVHRIVDPAFSERERFLTEHLSAALRDHDHPQDAYAAVYGTIRAERASRNVDGGTWVVADHTDPSTIIEHTHTSTLPASEVRSVAVASDGASAWVDTFSLIDDDQLIRTASNPVFFDRLVDVTEGRERSDPDRTAYPRLSPNDDATVVSASVDEVRP